MPYLTITYPIIPCHTIYHTLPYHTIPIYYTIPYHTMYYTIPYPTTLYTIPYYILHHTILYTIPYHAIPYLTITYPIMPIPIYYTIPYYTPTPTTPLPNLASTSRQNQTQVHLIMFAQLKKKREIFGQINAPAELPRTPRTPLDQTVAVPGTHWTTEGINASITPPESLTKSSLFLVQHTITVCSACQSAY